MAGMTVSNATTYDALDWSVDNCPIGRAMEILGERWTVVVLREVFNGIRRFDDLRIRTDIPRQVLSNRLSKLVDHGILRRVPYREPGARQRDEYRLTEKGFDLYPLLIAIRDWGDKYLVGEEGSPLTITHRDCGAVVHTEIHCESGHSIESPRDAVPRPGPGARLRRSNV
ncbi:HxlR family transcriptional regulator [Kribbella steppae]|uniref:HxlR family transcriptional regulator n=2 Tax=Kribbella steppae TaxID=2512223 RepID=A0A4R2HRA8_9ACTN|nr:HxlR family transcriptional regulator [Kribbella steppae]